MKINHDIINKSVGLVIDGRRLGYRSSIQHSFKSVFSYGEEGPRYGYYAELLNSLVYFKPTKNK